MAESVLRICVLEMRRTPAYMLEGDFGFPAVIDRKDGGVKFQ